MAIKFDTLLSGATYTFLARIVGTGLAFIVSIIVSRWYGAEMLGVLAVVQAFMMVFGVIALLGTNVSVLKFIPAHLANYSPTSAFHIYRKIQFIITGVAILLGIILFSSIQLLENSFDLFKVYGFYLSIASVLLISKAFADLSCEAVRAMRKVQLYAIMSILHNVLFFLIALCLAFFVSGENDPFWAILLAWIFTALIGIAVMEVLFFKEKSTTDLVEEVSYRSIITSSFPMMLTASMHLLIAQMAIFVLGIFCNPEQVGYYSAAVKLATVTLFVLQSINSMAAPKYSELFHAGKIVELLQYARRSSRLIFWFTIPIIIVLISWGSYLLSLFGQEFSTAYWPLVLLVVGQFINSISGSNGYFMNMTGNQVVFRNIILMAAIINILCCFALVPKLQLYGAAIANLISLAFWNIAALLYIKKKYGKFIGYIPFFNI